jgi:hypothetical protein
MWRYPIYRLPTVALGPTSGEVGPRSSFPVQSFQRTGENSVLVRHAIVRLMADEAPQRRFPHCRPIAVQWASWVPMQLLWWFLNHCDCRSL